MIRTFSISFPLCPRVQAWENVSYFSELNRNLLSFDTRRSLPKTNGLKWAVLRHNILRAREGKGIEELILRVKEAIFFSLRIETEGTLLRKSASERDPFLPPDLEGASPSSSIARGLLDPIGKTLGIRREEQEGDRSPAWKSTNVGQFISVCCVQSFVSFSVVFLICLSFFAPKIVGSDLFAA